METCDISLVKEEIVEPIKTEPQNEDEFEIKTEDPNLVGDFTDTINYEAQRFQTLDVERKSPWDGFLPIKEQIKDETDMSNSVNEIVKTEQKLYDSSLGIMDSNIDHFTPVDKSEWLEVVSDGANEGAGLGKGSDGWGVLGVDSGVKEFGTRGAVRGNLREALGTWWCGEGEGGGIPRHKELQCRGSQEEALSTRRHGDGVGGSPQHTEAL
uniref:Uncharacterized protein n=1 Tax=Timema bartmani TaxID=61472 RepID=A0A7R9F826_9NEOP|nr:unnamed protein product [Timema bartmani]